MSPSNPPTANATMIEREEGSMFGGHSASRKSEHLLIDLLWLTAIVSRTGRTGDIEGCQERVHGWATGEEYSEDLRRETCSLRCGLPFMLIQ